jgi:P-type conjugative transfer ATPase TrbB
MVETNKTLRRHLDMLEVACGEVIAQYLADDKVIDIMLNQDGKLWVESLDKGKFFTGTIISREKAANIIKMVAANRHIITDTNNPAVSCEIAENGSRFQAWLPPVVSAPIFTIRKRAINIFTLNDYVNKGGLLPAHAKILTDAIKARKNILVAGGTGSGKTTFTNALLNELKDSKDRIIVIEDLPELQVSAEDCVFLRTTEKVTMRDLVKSALRMRPDRIIIGEVRDGATLDLLKAWNTGHPGGICTIHANSTESTILRLENLIQEAVAVVPKHLIQEAIDLIVFMQRDENGLFRVVNISSQG